MSETLEIEASQLSKLLSEGAVLVDVREPDETASGAIPDAAMMPLSTFPEACSSLPETNIIVFYCRSGRRSIKACEVAEEWTDAKLYSLTGGYENYKQFL